MALMIYVQHISEVDFLEFQLNCELGDINNTVTRKPKTDFQLHCSSLVKVKMNFIVSEATS